MKLFVRVFQFINNLNSLVSVNGAKRKLVQGKEQKEKKFFFKNSLAIKCDFCSDGHSPTSRKKSTTERTGLLIIALMGHSHHPPLLASPPLSLFKNPLQTLSQEATEQRRTNKIEAKLMN